MYVSFKLFLQLYIVCIGGGNEVPLAEAPSRETQFPLAEAPVRNEVPLIEGGCRRERSSLVKLKYFYKIMQHIK